MGHFILDSMRQFLEGLLAAQQGLTTVVMEGVTRVRIVYQFKCNKVSAGHTCALRSPLSPLSSPSLREYTMNFGLTLERLAQADKPLTIMHPGPINRGVEISSEVADSEHAIILEQVENGVAVRMAVLYLLAQGRG